MPHRYAADLHGREFLVVRQQAQRQDASEQRRHRHEIGKAFGDRQGHEDKGIHQPIGSLADVIQLGKKLKEAEKHHQQGKHQKKPLDRAPPDVAIDDVELTHQGVGKRLLRPPDQYNRKPDQQGGHPPYARSWGDDRLIDPGPCNEKSWK